MSMTASAAMMGVDAAAPTDPDGSNMTVQPTPKIIFRKVSPGEFPKGEPDGETLALAQEIISRKYGSWVLVTGFDKLGHVPGSCLYKGGEQAWQFVHDRVNFWNQWSDEEWEEWSAWYKKRPYHENWTQDEWRRWKEDRALVADSFEAGPDYGRQGYDQRSRSPRTRAGASTYTHDDNDAGHKMPYTAGASSSSARP